jgi:hypothetical protein
VSRLRQGSRAPLAVAGILATPLFFVGLMAFSLKLDVPSQDVTKKGTAVLGDPTKSTIGKIYLYAALVSLAVVLVGVLAMLIRSRLAVIVPCVAAFLATLLLVLPLSTWRDEHIARYPLGVDLIPKSDPGDLILRGEWEQNAYTTARQIGFWTVAMSVVAIVLTVALEIRRRRGIVGPPVPPPPEVAAGEPQVAPHARRIP